MGCGHPGQANHLGLKMGALRRAKRESSGSRMQIEDLSLLGLAVLPRGARGADRGIPFARTPLPPRDEGIVYVAAGRFIAGT